MTGDSYHPISVYGFRVTKHDELDKLRDFYYKYIQEQKGKIVTRSVSRKLEIDIFYCMEYAYSRWEGMGNVEIFRENFGSGWGSAFAVLGLEITKEDYEGETGSTMDKMKPMYELTNTIREVLGNEEIKPAFYNGILMYPESEKEDYGIDESDEEC